MNNISIDAILPILSSPSFTRACVCGVGCGVATIMITCITPFGYALLDFKDRKELSWLLATFALVVVFGGAANYHDDSMLVRQKAHDLAAILNTEYVAVVSGSLTDGSLNVEFTGTPEARLFGGNHKLKTLSVVLNHNEALALSNMLESDHRSQDAAFLNSARRSTR